MTAIMKPSDLSKDIPNNSCQVDDLHTLQQPARRHMLGVMAATMLSPWTLTGCSGEASTPEAGLSARTNTRKTTLKVALAAALPSKMTNIGTSDYYLPSCHKTIDIAPLRPESVYFNTDGTLKPLASGESISFPICTNAPSAGGHALIGKWCVTVAAPLKVSIIDTGDATPLLDDPKNNNQRASGTWNTGSGEFWIQIKNIGDSAYSGDPVLRVFPFAESNNLELGYALMKLAKTDLQSNGMLRFMGDMGINNSTIQYSSDVTSEHGWWHGHIPPEVIGKIGSEAETAIWVPSYPNFSKEEMQKHDARLASYYPTGLVYKEYGNEGWNGLYSQFSDMAVLCRSRDLVVYAQDGSVVAKPDQTVFDQSQAQFAQGTLDTWTAAESVFGESRVVRVFGAMAANFDGTLAALQYIDPDTGLRLWETMQNDPGRHFIAIAPYFGTQYTSATQFLVSGLAPKFFSKHGLPGVDASKMSLNEQINGQYWRAGSVYYTKAVNAAIENARNWIRTFTAKKNSLGLTDVQLIAYENGPDEFFAMSPLDTGLSCGCVINTVENRLDIAGDNVTTFVNHFVDGDSIGRSWIPYRDSSVAMSGDLYMSAWSYQDVYGKIVNGGAGLELYRGDGSRILLAEDPIVVAFLVSVGGSTSGILANAIVPGSYMFTFEDGQSRKVNVDPDGVTASWKQPLDLGTLVSANALILYGAINITRYWQHIHFVSDVFYNGGAGLAAHKRYLAMLDAEGIQLRTQFTNVGGVDYSKINSVSEHLFNWGLRRGYTDANTPRSKWWNSLPR